MLQKKMIRAAKHPVLGQNRVTRSSATAEGPRDALYQSKSCQMMQKYAENPT